jgi:hypothetical protein
MIFYFFSAKSRYFANTNHNKKMKQKGILLAVFCILFQLCYSQHVTFLGVPITGSNSSFSAKMVQKGLECFGDQDENYYFDGTFAGYKGCSIVAVCENKKVYKVGVIFPSSTNMQEVRKNYSDLKASLIKKYGEPTYVKDAPPQYTCTYGIVVSPYNSYGKAIDDFSDNVELKCGAKWMLKDGWIQLEIMCRDGGVLSNEVVLLYFDNASYKQAAAFKEKAKSDL